MHFAVIPRVGIYSWNQVGFLNEALPLYIKMLNSSQFGVSCSSTEHMYGFSPQQSLFDRTVKSWGPSEPTIFLGDWLKCRWISTCFSCCIMLAFKADEYIHKNKIVTKWWWWQEQHTSLQNSYQKAITRKQDFATDTSKSEKHVLDMMMGKGKCATTTIRLKELSKTLVLCYKQTHRLISNH